ncbi:MAG TPA: glucose 1-dehydrogenase [Candidatus Elarobacter sp.]|jgi:NAD(P)-dependent dehydrogenase (short-subunit alcohol dehydrogenase family)|nr:glucose 1-dehydrogenase [Candidatus Elarobacter sp.]
MSDARLAGKTVLITGGASGIGLATAERALACGAHVAIGDVDAAAGERAARQHRGLHFVRLDVTSEPSWAQAVDDVRARFRRIDGLVNSAGIFVIGDVESLSLEDWRRTMAVNADGVFLGCRAAVRAMKDHGGSIVNLSSVSGIVGGHNVTAYNASKGAVRLLTKSVALHCARERYGIRCNSVHPTFVDTPMYRSIVALARDQEKMERALTAQVPLGRVAQPREVADAIVYLLSDESAFVTGSELVIDGGLTAQ